MRSFDENLRLYAQLTVQEGVGLAKGQELLVVAELDQTPFVHLVAEEAYRAGAKHVEVLWKDPELARIRLREGSDEAVAYAPGWLHDGTARAHRENAARLGIASADPESLAGFPAQRVAISSKTHSLATREISKIVAGDAINWCLVGAASEGWAKRVFPGLPPEQAVEALWQKIFLASRVLEPDPITAWQTHIETLKAKVAWLNDLRLDAVHFQGPGTDLRVGLVEGHRWAGGGGTAKNGIRCSPNIPTEEVFTMPHRLRVDGVVSSTKPLSVRGQVLDNIRVEFKHGEAIDATASVGQDALRNLLAADDGAKRLGEVALVPNSSKVSQTGTLFFNSLFDENAAAHIAVGASYDDNLAGIEAMSADEQLQHGANASMIHVDWMIGSQEIEVVGIRSDGSKLQLMSSGEWA